MIKAVYPLPPLSGFGNKCRRLSPGCTSPASITWIWLQMQAFISWLHLPCLSYLIWLPVQLFVSWLHLPSLPLPEFGYKCRRLSPGCTSPDSITWNWLPVQVFVSWLHLPSPPITWIWLPVQLFVSWLHLPSLPLPGFGYKCRC